MLLKHRTFPRRIRYWLRMTYSMIRRGPTTERAVLFVGIVCVVFFLTFTLIPSSSNPNPNLSLNLQLDPTTQSELQTSTSSTSSSSSSSSSNSNSNGNSNTHGNKGDSSAANAKPPKTSSSTSFPAEFNPLNTNQYCLEAAPVARKTVSLTIKGWLGNYLFQLYSALGIAACSNATAALTYSHQLHHEYQRAIDGSLFPVILNTGSRGGPSRTESGWGKHDTELYHFSPDSSNVVVDGYLQSYKYFANIYEPIQASLARFRRNEIPLPVDSYYDKAPQKCRIAMHVRRGDMLSLTNLYWVPTAEWLRLALDTVVQESGCDADDIFVLIGCGGPNAGADDECASWLQREMKLPYRHKQLRAGTYETMAVLGSAQHAVVPTGTYSWWIGFQVKGMVVTCPNFFSDMSTYNIDDYVPKSWKKLTKDVKWMD
jgi:hypothetical protein